MFSLKAGAETPSHHAGLAKGPNMSNTPSLSMSVGRDYSAGALASWYEFVIYQREEIISRKGGFTSRGAAKRAGLKAAQSL